MDHVGQIQAPQIHGFTFPLAEEYDGEVGCRGQCGRLVASRPSPKRTVAFGAFAWIACNGEDGIQITGPNRAGSDNPQ